MTVEVDAEVGRPVDLEVLLGVMVDEDEVPDLP